MRRVRAIPCPGPVDPVGCLAVRRSHGGVVCPRWCRLQRVAGRDGGDVRRVTVLRRRFPVRQPACASHRRRGRDRRGRSGRLARRHSPVPAHGSVVRPLGNVSGVRLCPTPGHRRRPVSPALDRHLRLKRRTTSTLSGNQRITYRNALLAACPDGRGGDGQRHHVLMSMECPDADDEPGGFAGRQRPVGWIIWRQDDNGNRFEVARKGSPCGGRGTRGGDGSAWPQTDVLGCQGNQVAPGRRHERSSAGVGLGGGR